MRPGQFSKGGFLGMKESLEYVITQDAKTLEALGIDHDLIANTIEKILMRVREQQNELSFDEKQARHTDYPSIMHPENTPHFSKENLPDTNLGYHVDNLQIFIRQYRGSQGCPWGCSEYGSFDFMLLNKKSGELFIAPALIVHLIRVHRFFEGTESPYRVEPKRIAHTLGLI
jgi:hypothetical protein